MSPDLILLCLLWTLIGVTVGIVIGAIPGLTGAMAISLTLPLTFAMEANSALALLVSMYVGSVSGGLISATLLKMPGTPASMMTTFDAYPMAARSRPRRALALGIGASFVGGFLSWIVLVALAKPIAAFSVKLSSFDFLALILLALVLVAVISRGDMIRGLLSASLGILVALPRITPTGQERLTFGLPQMGDGFKLLPVLIGLFAVSEAIRLAGRGSEAVPEAKGQGGRLPSWGDWKRQVLNLIRSSMIGSFVGVLPGIGANVGSVLAYGAAKTVAEDREEFGKGADSGIVASESANNATVGGALVPLIALGIPGSVIDAILLGAFVIHGLQPGPLLFENSPHIVATITWSYLAANVLMFLIMWFGIGALRRLIHVPAYLLVPAVFVFSVVGSFALRNQMFDVWVMLAFGLIGLALDRFRIPLAPFVLAFVLAPMGEDYLLQGLTATGGHAWPLVTRPLSLVFLAVAALILVAPLLPWFRLRPGPEPASSEG